MIITISTAICKKNNKTFDPCIRAIFHTYCCDNFNPCSMFENLTSFTPTFKQELEQGKLMAAVDSQKYNVHHKRNKMTPMVSLL